MEAVLYKIKHFFGRNTKKNDISSFFRYASKKEQERVFLRVIEQANKDQKELVESNKKV